MPLYSFVDSNGLEIEVYYGMEEAPEIGSTVNHDGQSLTRIPSLMGGVVKEYRHVSHSLPRVNPKDPYWPHYDSHNRPVFTSKAQVQKLSDKLRGSYGSGFRYD